MQVIIIVRQMKLDSSVMEVNMMAIMADSSLIGTLGHWLIMVILFSLLQSLLSKALALLQRLYENSISLLESIILSDSRL